jgi:integrase
LTPARIVEGRSRLEIEKGKHRSKATVKRYLAALSHVLSIALREFGWIEANPMTKVAMPKESEGRIRYLNDDERDRLLAGCKEGLCPYLYAIVILAISTGARKSEITELTWKQIDCNHNRIILEKTKNGSRRSLALTGHALDQIKALSKFRRLDTQLVFPNKSGSKGLDIRSAWERALKRAQIEDFRFHDLRHTCASYLAMNGASGPEIAAVLGHKTLSMVKRYAHIGDDHIVSVVGNMNDKIFLERAK